MVPAMTHQETSDTGDDRVSFGFRDVARSEKPGLVRGVFRSVASRYDLMNDLLSLGVHRAWKDATIDWLNPRPGQRFVDVAGGTGDLAFRIAERTADRAEVTVIDLTPDMVVVGRERAIEYGLDDNVRFSVGDALSLAVPSNHFDGYTIGFGIRNVASIETALAEAHRVLKPGGRFLCLEFSHVEVPLLEQIYKQWSFRVMPQIGASVAGDRESYQYLVESIARFPAQEDFAQMIRQAGFAQVSYRNLSGGIAALHSGWKI